MLFPSHDDQVAWQFTVTANLIRLHMHRN